MCTLQIRDTYYSEVVTITRATRHQCTAVARAHYKGDRYVWTWL